MITIATSNFKSNGGPVNIIHTDTAGSGSALYGGGIPEGSVTAEPGITYLDTTSNALWMKRTGSGNTGWIEIAAGA